MPMLRLWKLAKRLKEIVKRLKEIAKTLFQSRHQDWEYHRLATYSGTYCLVQAQSISFIMKQVNEWDTRFSRCVCNSTTTLIAGSHVTLSVFQICPWCA